MMAVNNVVWNEYLGKYGYEPKDASQLQKFSEICKNMESLSFKDARITFNANKGKGYNASDCNPSELSQLNQQKFELQKQIKLRQTNDDHDDLELKLKQICQKIEKLLDPNTDIQTNKYKLLICGYIRNNTVHNNDILSFGLNIISEYYKKLNHKYIDILIDKTQHEHLGIKSCANDHKFDKNSDWYFDTNICRNCWNENCVQFVANYKNEALSDVNNIKTNIWFNNCNEYQCNVCKYYIGVNIKYKYIEYHYEHDEDCGIYSRGTNIYSTLMKPSNLKKRIEGESAKENQIKYKCIECDSEMEIIERGKHQYAYNGFKWNYIDYCGQCQLIRKHFKDTWSFKE